jgi:hypothetical protein
MPPAHVQPVSTREVTNVGQYSFPRVTAGLQSMASEPSDNDKSLLERLNALKPSTVQLERRKSVAIHSFCRLVAHLEAS